MRDREKYTHRSSFRPHYDFLFMPLGLNNTLVIIHYCRKWHRNMFLLFHVLIIYSRTWEFHLSKLDETCDIVAMS
jgi:hypothetical protein